MFNAITGVNSDPRPGRSALPRASNAFVPGRAPKVPNNRDAHKCRGGRCEHHQDQSTATHHVPRTLKAGALIQITSGPVIGKRGPRER
jgi:hypothetical protein